MSNKSSRTRIKMCGITRAIDLHDAVAAGADALGFVLYDKSPRAVSPTQAGALAALLPPFVIPVLLFVNPTAEVVRHAIEHVPHAILQFHGDESAHFCESFARPYIRAIGISSGDSTTQLEQLLGPGYHPRSSALLLDSLSPQYGGSGTSFNWDVLPHAIGRHVILSGGLHAENVQQGIRTLAPRCLSLSVDVSSGIEASKGIKDVDKMRSFTQSVWGVSLS